MTLIERIGQVIDLEKMGTGIDSFHENTPEDDETVLFTLVEGSAGHEKYNALLEMFGAGMASSTHGIDPLESAKVLMRDIMRELNNHFENRLYMDTMVFVYEHTSTGDVIVTVGVNF